MCFFLFFTDNKRSIKGDHALGRALMKERETWTDVSVKRRNRAGQNVEFPFYGCESQTREKQQSQILVKDLKNTIDCSGIKWIINQIQLILGIWCPKRRE